jgi:hypothetical protein
MKAGDYAALASIIKTLTAEHLEGDRKSTAVLGFAHAWRLAEGSRTGGDPTIIESASVAHRMFETAYRAFPEDPRLLGFQGAMMMAEGSINENPELSRSGYVAASNASMQWPEWGLFTLAYGMGSQPPDSERGREVIEAMWRNAERCGPGRVVSRTATEPLTFLEEAARSPEPLVARACANQPVAPYNFEGFFAAFGDLLARSGKVEQARRMYETALSASTSASWPFRKAIEQRRDEVADLPSRWAMLPPRGQALGIDAAPLFRGPANCSICHQGQP